MHLPDSKAGGEEEDSPPSLPPPAASTAPVEEQLESTRRLLHALSQVHADFITHGDHRPLFERLLALVIELTRSERGFIAEVHHSPGGAVSLHLLAAQAWADSLRDSEALVAPALTSSKPVLIPDSGPSTQGGPDGAPPLRAFMALPFQLQGGVAGVVGLAQRPGGYDASVAEFLQPVLTTCGTLLYARREAEQRLLNEQALLAQQAQLRKLALVAARTDNAVIITDPAGLIEWVNEGFTRITGYTLQEVVGRKPGAVLQGPDTDPKGIAAMREALSRGEGITVELLNYGKSGRPYWNLIEIQPVHDDRGKLVQFVAMESDVTARRQLEEQLQAFLQAIPDMLYRVRLDGHCLAFKQSLIDPPLMTPEMFLGKNLFEVLPERVVTHLRAALQRVTHDSSLEIFEYSMEMPFGVQQYEARVVPSGPDEGMCIVRNITVRKALEDQRRRQREELEERVRQATRELEARQAQLIQSEKLASLGQMAASIAHEINNPVGYVSSNISTLAVYTSVMRRLLELYLQVEETLSPGPPDSVAELLEQARELRKQERLEDILLDMDELLSDSREGIARIREFIQDLKTFVREETGTAQHADLNKLLQVTLRMLRHELKYKVQVRLDFGPLPLVRCFPTQLNQVFVNLLVNAAHAIEQRGEIHIITRREGNEVLVRIKDTGKGMSPETLNKLFTPFFTTKPPGQGTGLGLSICYAIINRHKGRIEVDSELGKGTTFTVRVPLTEE